MSVKFWRWTTWAYHILFLFAVTWPGQALVNSPTPFVFGLPRQMAWIAAWLVGSLIVLWRLSGAENRERQRQGIE